MVPLETGRHVHGAGPELMMLASRWRQAWLKVDEVVDLARGNGEPLGLFWSYRWSSDSDESRFVSSALKIYSWKIRIGGWWCMTLWPCMKGGPPKMSPPNFEWLLSSRQFYPKLRWREAVRASTHPKLFALPCIKMPRSQALWMRTFVRKKNTAWYGRC